MLEKLLKGALTGDAEAMFQLGTMYAFGNGVAVDLDEALHWLKKAASRGHMIASEVLKDIGRTQETINETVECKGEKKRKLVQLWEGGPCWADRNIGAENPWDFGYYFWWGDTVGYEWKNGKWVASDGSNTIHSFDKKNTPTCDRGCFTLQNDGWITADGVLAPNHDAAQKHWGGGWRMPTEDEFKDLICKCDWTWATTNGVNGYTVRGRGNYESKSIFLPCAGYGNGTSLHYAGSEGYYWSSVPYSGFYYTAEFLYFYCGSHSTRGNYRNPGHSVRPVQGVTK